jgi:sterol desaturase/sphingolipid hydroxylase (fatty acid hydroxylase superfamily)
MIDETPKVLFALTNDPTKLPDAVIASIWRNLSAEAWFYCAIFLALGISVLVKLLQKRDLRNHFLSNGFRVDLVYAALEFAHLVQLLAIIPVTAFFTISLRTYFPWATFDASTIMPAWMQLFVLFYCNDFVAYWWHRLQHEKPIFWQFHKTHHSQKHLTVFTTFRSTIVDRSVAVLVLAMPAAVMQVDATMPLTIVTILTFHQLLIHSDTALHCGPLEKIFVSPSFHEVHHSTLPSHLDKNYGAVLAVWDHLFGTAAQRGDQPLIYGVIGEEIPESYIRQQFVPLLGIWKLLKSRWFREKRSVT